MEEKDHIYNELIKNISIEDLIVLEAKAKRDEDFKLPARIHLDKKQPNYKNEKDKIKVYIEYSLTATEEGEKRLGVSISVKYMIIYKTKTKMNDDLFERFSKTSLIIETWPYFRHYVHETTLNFGLPPLVLKLSKH